MDVKSPECALLERLHNFRWINTDPEKLLNGDQTIWPLLSALEILITNDIDGRITIRNAGKEELLRSSLFSEVFEFALEQLHPELKKILDDNPTACSDVYEASLFYTLCQFLHTSKRIKGMSLRSFVLNNDPLDFNKPGSPNYGNPSLLENQVEKLRKSRNRLLSKRPAYIKNTQGHSISKDSEDEWRQWYDLDKEPILKRWRNLYNDIEAALKSKKDKGYKDRIIIAYNKFLSKLKKINFEQLLAFYKTVFSYLSENKKYYGINLYRLEKEMRPYRTIITIKKLSECMAKEKNRKCVIS